MKLFLAVVALFAVSEALNVPDMPNPRTISNGARIQSSPAPEETWDYRVVETLGVSSLRTGQVVEAVYKTPNTGRVSVSLRTAGGDYALLADARISVFSYKTIFSLYTYTLLTGWDKEIDVDGFPFTCPPVSTTVSVRITVQENDFLITVNNVELATFPFHESLTPDLVRTIECGLGDISAPVKGSVETLSVSF